MRAMAPECSRVCLWDSVPHTWHVCRISRHLLPDTPLFSYYYTHIQDHIQLIGCFLHLSLIYFRVKQAKCNRFMENYLYFVVFIYTFYLFFTKKFSSWVGRRIWETKNELCLAYYTAIRYIQAIWAVYKNSRFPTNLGLNWKVLLDKIVSGFSKSFMCWNIHWKISILAAYLWPYVLYRWYLKMTHLSPLIIFSRISSI